MPPRRPVPGDTADPDAMPALVGEFCEWLLVRGYSKATVDGYYVNLVLLTEWLAERGITRPVEVTRPVLEGYQRALFHLRQANGRPLTHRTQLARLVAARGFFRWLAHGHRILYNPAAELELPRVPRWTPRATLTVAEVEDVMGAVDLDTTTGVRDRAILEVLYSTAVRSSELAALSVFDLDVVSGTLMVNAGKGGRARMVPIGERAIAWCEKYLTGSRPNLAVPPDDNWLFLADRGGPFTGKRLTYLTRRYLNAAGVDKAGACHLFRHTAATLMLDGGADIRHVQALLGHAELTTTQIYTQVSIRALKAVHTATHPGASTNSRARPTRGLTESALGSRLFAALAAEADQDDDDLDSLDLDDGDGDLDLDVERPVPPERPLKRRPRGGTR